MKLKIILCLALVLSVFSAKIADAQPGPFYESSLEARIAEAQSVFRGVISNWTRTGTQDGSFKLTLTVQVDEVIKGPPRKTMEFAPAVFNDDTNQIKEWTERHTPFLCLVDGSSGQSPAGTNHEPVLPLWNVIRYGGFGQFDWNVICLGDAVPGERTIGNDQPAASLVKVMDTTYLSKPEEILERAREFAKSDIGTAKIDYLDLEGLVLAVPVSPSLEAVARRLVRLPDGDGMRAVGAKALRYFKSAENIELLKPLLNDLGTNLWQIHNEPWLTKRIYPARQAAYTVLQEWGVTVPKPVTEEVLPWEFDPAVRQKLKVQVPTELWIDRTANMLTTVTQFVEKKDTTNVWVGSNMIAGVRFAWFVFPAGTPRQADASRLDLEYTPENVGRVMYFLQARDGLPVPGQKYNIEMDYTVFETDKPPPPDYGNSGTDAWRPQDGKNYRVLLQRTLKNTSE